MRWRFLFVVGLGVEDGFKLNALRRAWNYFWCYPDSIFPQAFELRSQKEGSHPERKVEAKAFAWSRMGITLVGYDMDDWFKLNAIRIAWD